MPEHLDEAGHRTRFRAMHTIELTSAWEEPMPDQIRALLLAELEDRRYRVKSLPKPPASDWPPAVESFPGSGPAAELEALRKRDSLADRRVREYRPARRLTMTLRVMLIVSGGLACLVQLLNLVGVLLYPTFADPFAEVASQGELVLVAGYGILALIFFPVLLTTHIIFLVWINRANKNARALGARRMKYGPGFCVGCWFIPFANLALPYAAVKEIYVASDQEDRSRNWRETAVPGFFPIWWTAWIVGMVLDRVYSRIDAAADPTLDGWLGIAAGSSLLVAGILANLVVRAIHRRQESKFPTVVMA